MPVRIGNSPIGVGHKHPVIRRCVSFSATSSFLLWQLRHQTGGGHIPLHYRRMQELTYEWWVFWHPMTSQQGSAGYCCVQGFSGIGPRVNWRSSLTPRYVGLELYGKVLPRTLTANWRFVSLFRLKAVDVGLVTLSFSFHAERFARRVSTTWESNPRWW